jgi:predicted RNA-binding Zn-ribbon protein involved in translation (DUF1610 family)
MSKEERRMDKVMCDNCGEMVFRRKINIENLHRYDTSSKEAFINSLMSLEGASLEQAVSWSEHGLYEKCPTKVRNCPECGVKLKTWRASLCTKCGAKFESTYISHESS